LSNGGPLPLRSIAYILASTFCFAVVGGLAKLITLLVPANEISFFRMLFGLLSAFATCLRGRSVVKRLRHLDLRDEIIRALTLLMAWGLFFAGVPYMPLGEAVAIVYSETLIVVVLAPFMLNERFTVWSAATAMVGFAGVLLAVRPNGGHTSWFGPVFLLLSAFFGALSIVQIRRIHAAYDSITTVFFHVDWYGDYGDHTSDQMATTLCALGHYHDTAGHSCDRRSALHDDCFSAGACGDPCPVQLHQYRVGCPDRAFGVE